MPIKYFLFLLRFERSFCFVCFFKIESDVPICYVLYFGFGFDCGSGHWWNKDGDRRGVVWWEWGMVVGYLRLNNNQNYKYIEKGSFYNKM